MSAINKVDRLLVETLKRTTRDLFMRKLTSCSEHITSSVHLPSHFPILDGSGRGLEPRRLRGKDESPFRSRLAKRLGSKHSLPKMTRPRPPDTHDARDSRFTARDPSCRLGEGGWWWLSVNSRAAFSEGASTSHRPAAVQPTPTTGSPRPHLPERGHTKAQRKTESCHKGPAAMNQNQDHMMPHHRAEDGRRGGDPAVLPRLMRGCMHSVMDKADRCDSPISRNRRAPSLLSAARIVFPPF